MWRVWVQPLVRELRSHMPHGQKIKCTKKRYRDKLNEDFLNSF